MEREIEMEAGREREGGSETETAREIERVWREVKKERGAETESDGDETD